MSSKTMSGLIDCTAFLILCISVTRLSANDDFTLAAKEVQDTSILLSWGPLPEQLHSPEYNCSFHYVQEDSPLVVHSPPFVPPQNQSFLLRELSPNTSYSINMACSVINASLHSQQLNITTALPGESHIFRSSSLPPGSDETESNDEVTNLTSSHQSTLDIVLGLIFGIGGAVIVIAGVYYVVVKFRRRQRIRRFLQYRQQENEPFPGLADGDDDSEHD